MENKKEKTKFEQLTSVDCSAHIDKKDTGTATLSYLSWAWAWDYFKKAYPDAKYEIKEWDGKPYLFDEKTGYMVETSITAGGETYIMWLPVMDNSNRAMLDKPYKIQTKFKTIDVAPATMFDINKSIMRCLVKNMAMFGLGLYIYAGEDLPADTDEYHNQSENAPQNNKPSVDDIVAGMSKMTADTVKRFYARAIEIYGKETPEYKIWIKAWADKKDELEKAATQKELNDDAEYINSL